MRPYQVLSIDGGGIRGLYSACILDGLMRRFAVKRGVGALDVGKGFDLIAGTSTGAILGCGLAYGCSPSRLVQLYREKGPELFNGEPIPTGRLAFVKWAWKHRSKPIHGNTTLKVALMEIFGDETLGSIFTRRAISLCVPSVRLLNESPRVFKTPHRADYFRDNDIKLVEVCLATAAAPLFLPLATVKETEHGTPEVFADGGLWMNNPTLVALLEALVVTPPNQEITILSIGTCPAPAGDNPAAIDLNRGLVAWKAGGKALELSMNAQACATAEMLRRLAKEFTRLGRKITVIRCYESKLSAEQSKVLTLDNASQEALGLLTSLGENDAAETFRWVQENTDLGQVLSSVFASMPTKLNDN